MLLKGDSLDHAIQSALKQVQQEPPNIEVSEYLEEEDVNGLISGLPTLEDVLSPPFFKHAPLPFNLLRRALYSHDVNPVSNGMMKLVPLSESERADARLSEQIWFLLFLGAPAHFISESLDQHRSMRTQSPAMSIQNNSREIFSQVRENPSHSARTQQDVRNITYLQGAQVLQKPTTHSVSPQEPNISGNSRAPINNSAQARNLQLELLGACNRAIEADTTTHEQNNFSRDPAYVQSKKVYKVECCFKDRMFTGAPEQSVDNLI